MRMEIRNTAELESHLSLPTDADVSAMAALDGDLLILGVGGKMGPSLARLARRAADLAATRPRVVAVARFSNPDLPAELSSLGIETIACDLLEPGALARLPEIANVIFMAARKFGSSGAEHLTWASFDHDADAHVGPAMCTHCASSLKGAPPNPRQSARLASTRNPPWAASACSNMAPQDGEPASLSCA